MRSFDWKAGLPFALALTAIVAIPQDAFAQFFFRPFANIFRRKTAGGRVIKKAPDWAPLIFRC